LYAHKHSSTIQTKKDMINKLRILLLTLVLATSTAVYAELPPEPIDTTGPSSVPVDGGASLLLAAGAFAGFKRLKKSK